MKCKTGPLHDEPVAYLDQDAMRRLLAAAKRRSVRDHLLLALSYRLGLRVSEAIGLQAGDLDLRRGEVAVRGLKGGTARRYAFPPDLLPLARRWARLRGDHAGSFFTSRQGDSLTRQRCWQIVRACAEAAGVTTQTGKSVRFHTLRHSIGTHLVDARMPLETVADVLRHRSIRSTSRYAVTSLRRRADYLREIERAPEIVKVRR
jgi:integrase/recombinase XerD